MAEIDISVIVPIKNTVNDIDKIIESVINNNSNINFEFIITDISTDNKSMIAALNAINKLDIKGSVVQCGDNICDALNSGICRSQGKYLTFLFPKRLYINCISQYFNDAKVKNSDFVFGTQQINANKEILLFDSSTPLDILEGIIYESIACDIASVLISTDFLKKNSIYFSENIKVGYSEEFIYKVLLNASTATKSNALMIREKTSDSDKKANETDVGHLCFDKVETMLKIKENLSTFNNYNGRLNNIFIGEKIPSAIFSCIDTLLKEKYTIKAIKNALKHKNYEDMLCINKYTSSSLKKKIYIWKLAPHLYKIDK